MTPDILVKQIKSYGLSTEEIAEKIGCSISLVVKLANGSRNQPSYILMDKLRDLHKTLQPKKEEEYDK